MTLTVSVGEFRRRLSDYLAKAAQGDTIVIKDKKKDDIIAELKGRRQFDPVAYGQALRRAAGTFTAKNHPEWATEKKVENWLRKTRLQGERHFNTK